MRKIDWLNPGSAQRIKIHSGQVYEFVQEIRCRNGDIHPAGSRLHVHDSTIEAPFDEIGPNGVNWICRTKFGITIWSTLEHCIERKVIKRLCSVEQINLHAR